MKIFALTVVCVLVACFSRSDALPGRWDWLSKVSKVVLKTPKRMHNFHIPSAPHISGLSPSGNAWRKGLREMSIQPAYNPHYNIPKVHHTQLGYLGHSYPASQGLSGLGNGGKTLHSNIHFYPPSNGLSGGLSTATHVKPISYIPSAPVEEVQRVRKPPLYEYNVYRPMPIVLKNAGRQMNVTAENSSHKPQIDILLIGIFIWNLVRSLSA